MTRDLKALGLALVAVFAMSAAVASTASAGEVTSDGPFYLVGTELAEGNELKYPGLPSTKCSESHFKSGLNSSGATEFVVSPSYTNCKVGIFPATVKMTSCSFQFWVGFTTGGAGTYGVQASVVCAVDGHQVHLDVYTDGKHQNLGCSLTFGAQTPSGQGLHATNQVFGTRIHGSLSGISATRTNFGICPPAGSTTEASYDVNVEVAGESEEEEETATSISGS